MGRFMQVLQASLVYVGVSGQTGLHSVTVSQAMIDMCVGAQDER